VAQQRHQSIASHTPIDIRHLLFHLVTKRQDFERRRVRGFEALHDLEVRLRQQAQVDIFPVELPLGGNVGSCHHLGRPQTAPDDVTVVQIRGQLLDPAIGEQALDELLTRVFLALGSGGQERLRLQVEQPRCHP